MTTLAPEAPVLPEDPFDEVIPEDPSGVMDPEVRKVIQQARQRLIEWGWCVGTPMSHRIGSVCAVGALVGAQVGRTYGYRGSMNRDAWWFDRADFLTVVESDLTLRAARELILAGGIIGCSVVDGCPAKYGRFYLQQWNDGQVSIEPVLALFDKALA